MSESSVVYTAGDYQTAERMRLKLQAIPIPDLRSKTVLDIGCDHGAWCKLASDHGAKHVLGIDHGRHVRTGGGGTRVFVNLAERNAAQGWPRTEFRDTDLGKSFPSDLGKFDVVFFFSIYHHLWRDVQGDHDAIWKWLHSVTGGVLLFEGPIDVRDAIAKMRMRETPGREYSKAAILEAASRYFDVEQIGPALHRPHRVVWRLYPREVPPNDRDRSERVRQGEQGNGKGTESGGAEGAVGLGAISGHGQPGTAGSGPAGHRPGRTSMGDGARDPHRPSEVVARNDPGDHVQRGGNGREGTPDQHSLSGAGRASRTAFLGDLRRGRIVRDPTIALVIGGAKCVWSDLRELESLMGGAQWPGLIVAVNDIGVHIPYIDHWASLHPQKFKTDRQDPGHRGWIQQRADEGLPNGFLTWSRNRGQADRVITTEDNGSSGLTGTLVALEVAERAVLCGIPMTKTAHFDESRVHAKDKPWQSNYAHFRTWEKPRVRRLLAGRVRSISGNTRSLLGAPTVAFIAGRDKPIEEATDGKEPSERRSCA